VKTANAIRLDLPADLGYLALLRACVAEMLIYATGAVEPIAYADEVQLAVHEICANIIRHAYADRSRGRVRVVLTLAARPRRLVIELRDRGRSFEPAAVPDPGFAEPREGGYGLFLARKLLDEVTYRASASGNRWRLVKHL
jgi:serine/threonine-protein kinase RsbW